MNRREVLKSALAGTVDVKLPVVLQCDKGAFGGVRRLSDKMAVMDGGGSNVCRVPVQWTASCWWTAALRSRRPKRRALKTFVPNAKVTTLFNTHYHVDQTGNNEMFSAAGAKIIAHKRTLEWMSSDHWVTAEDRYEKARPKAARPTRNVSDHRFPESGRRADRLRLSDHWPTRTATFTSSSGMRMFLRWATSPRRCAIRRSIISPARGSAAAWMRWISS